MSTEATVAELLAAAAATDLEPRPLKQPVPSGMRIGLIGAGRIVHSGVMPSYRSVGIVPVAAADPDPIARVEIKRIWGVQAVYDDWRVMIDREQLDILDVNIRWDVGLSPMRVDIVREAAVRRINVLMAKPMAETWDQCVEMVHLARAAGIHLAIDHNTRYAPAFHGCRALLQAGLLGPLLSASINYHAALGRQHTNAFDAAQDVSVHAVDVLLSWFDREPIQVFASWSRRVDEVGSVLAAIFAFDGGANAMLLYDFATRHRRQFEFIAVGTEASVDGLQDQELPGPSRMLTARLRYGPYIQRGLALDLPLQYALSPGSYLATRLDLMQSIASGDEPWASGRNVLRTMRSLFAMKRSIQEGRAIDLVDMGLNE